MSNNIFSFIRKKKKLWRESAWLLGICESGFSDLKQGNIHWVSNGVYEGKKWFADPFILDYDDEIIYLLVEEFDYKIHRGRIAKLTIDRQLWTVKDCNILLDLPTHLSFPMIWRERGEVYVCPENYASGGWNIYRYNTNTDTLEYVQRLIGEKLTDATLLMNDGIYWLLSTFDPKPNGSQLSIWKSVSLMGPYSEAEQIKFNENVARNAGMVFEYGNKLIRPAQECNHVYGHSISFQELNIINGKFDFKEAYRFYSPHRAYDSGTHTFNQYKDMAVIDVKGYRHPAIGKILRFASGVLIKLHLKNEYHFD